MGPGTAISVASDTSKEAMEMAVPGPISSVLAAEEVVLLPLSAMVDEFRSGLCFVRTSVTQRKKILYKSKIFYF